MIKYFSTFSTSLLAGISIALTGTLAHADETPKYRCTSDSAKIERLTVIYADANVHGELSYTYYMDVVDAAGVTKRFWIENAETVTATSFAGRFTDFGSKAEVVVNVDPTGKRTEISEVILNGETIRTYCVALSH